MINFPFVLLREGHNPLKYKITSVAHPLFVAECVQGLPSPPQLVQATISFGPLCSRRFSPCNDTRRAIWQEEREREKKSFPLLPDNQTEGKRNCQRKIRFVTLGSFPLDIMEKYRVTLD
jgi:hypothetical protein